MIRALAMAAAVAVGALAYGADPASPPALQGTGLDLLAWGLREFGWPFLFGWVAWQLRGFSGKFVGIPVSIGPVEHVHRLHPETEERVVAMLKSRIEAEEPESSEERPARPRPVSQAPRRPR